MEDIQWDHAYTVILRTIPGTVRIACVVSSNISSPHFANLVLFLRAHKHIHEHAHPLSMYLAE